MLVNASIFAASPTQGRSNMLRRDPSQNGIGTGDSNRKWKTTAVRTSLAVVLAALTTGCAAYSPPGGPAQMVAESGVDLQKQEGVEPSLISEFERKPMASLPTGVAVARVQAPDYQTHTSFGINLGS